ncbi:MAG: hypothetical protein AABY80_00085, partial [Candidatus Deferrimicrobiota bacterium]
MGSLKAPKVSARALTILSLGMAVRAARTLAASLNSIFSASAPPRFLAGESNEGNPLNEMVAHIYQSAAMPVK